MQKDIDMALDITKIKSHNDRIDELALKEIYEELPEGLMTLVRHPALNQCLLGIKSAKREDVSARVLNNWENQGIVNVSSEDKGRVKRFNKLESVWLSIINEARKFGLPLEILKQARKELFSSPIKDFNLLKFCVLHTILYKPKMIAISEDGYVRHYSHKIYKKHLNSGVLPMHLSFNLSNILKKEFPRNHFEKDFKIDNLFSNSAKLLMLYFLKTGDFKEIRLTVHQSDTRLITSSEIFLNNPDLSKALFDWNFERAEIIINDQIATVITTKA